MASDTGSSLYGQSIPSVVGEAWLEPLVVWARSTIPTVSDPVGTQIASAFPNATIVNAYQAKAMGAMLLVCKGPGTIVAMKIAGVRYGAGATGSRTLSDGFKALAAKQPVEVDYTTNTTSSGHYSYSTSIPRWSFRVMHGDFAAAPWGKAYTASTSVAGGVTTYGFTEADITGGVEPAWPYFATLSSSPPAGCAWPGLVMLQYEAIRLNERGKIPHVEFLVQSTAGASTVNAADAAHTICALAGIPDANVITDVGGDGTSASSFRAYCSRASAFQVSGIVNLGETTVNALLQSLMQASNGQVVRSGALLKFLPLGDLADGAFTPPTTAVVVNPTDLLDESVVQIDFVDESERFNKVTVKYTPTGDSEESAKTYTDQADVRSRRVLVGSDISNRWIVTAAHAQWVAQLAVARSVHRRRKYKLTIPGRYAYLEDGDLLSLSDGRAVVGELARIDKIRLTSDGDLEIEAWNWVQGSATPIDLTPQEREGDIVAPGDNATLVEEELLSGTTAAAAAQSTAETAATLQPGIDSLFPNPTSELSPPAGAPLDGAAWANRYNAGASAYAGSWVRRIVTVTGGGQYQEAPAFIAPCVSGERFTFQARLSERTAANASTRGYLWVRFYDGSGTVISSSPDALDIRHIGSNAWTTLSVTTVPAPVGAVTVRASYGVDCTAGAVVGETYWWDELLLRRMLSESTLGCACTVQSGSAAPSFTNLAGFESASLETSADGFQVLRLDFKAANSRPYQVIATIVNDDGATHPNNYSLALKTETALSTRCRLQLVAGITRFDFDSGSYNRIWYITVMSL